MKNHYLKTVAFYLLLFSTILILFNIAFAQFDPKIFSQMRARSIGPAGMSGRIGDIQAVVSDPNIIYVGAATGGVWKSDNGGITWESIFDDQPASSIGSIAIFQQNPSIIWVGTGEGNPRNSVGVGNGIYKSLDGGRNWQYLGLKKTEKIYRILLHPSNENIAYVAALGTTWGENPERGVFKTVDGGKTWQRILFVDEKTGCADLVMDPVNPNKLFAAMWEHRRWPWFFKSGGAGSGLYVTHNGGENWEKLTEKAGLPKGELGRIGIAISKSSPNVVYSLIEAAKSALCRSDDGGRKWTIVNQSPNVNPRPFYYADIRVDPENENRIYSLHSNLTVSEDGGKSFDRIRSRVHSDHHALWIHPENGKLLIDGNDGGVAISYDGGTTWRFVDNLPLAQFYHISVDKEIPYNIYGGMQDNGSWRGPSQVWENDGIRNYHWEEVGYGDGFATLSDPTDSNIGYSMSQGGYLKRFNLVTGERKDIRPSAPDSIKLRFNWNAAIAIDPFEPATIYYGSQFVHKSTDRGDSWAIISPDLTTNNPEKQKQAQSGGLTFDVTDAENHTTILTIAPSPVKQGVIWIGTDDGQVHVSQDNGISWKNVTKNIPKLPETTWCPHIEASKFDTGTAYAVFDDHRRSNWTPYIFKTENFGKSWKSLTKNDPIKNAGTAEPAEWGFVHVIEQDPVKKELLFMGTEFGLFISFDDGKNWQKWTHGVPTVPVRALIVHPRDHDLIIGTHGRAAFILNDIRPLRQISEELLKKTLHLFEIPAAYQHETKASAGYHFPADAFFSGENVPYGACLTFYINPDKLEALKQDKTNEQVNSEKEEIEPEKNNQVQFEFYDTENKLVRKMETEPQPGLNRIYWNLRGDGFETPSLTERRRDYSPPGPELIPGIFTVKIKFKKNEDQQTVEILPDPRINIPLEERKEKFDQIMQAVKYVEIVAQAVTQIHETNQTIDMMVENLKDKQDSTSVELTKTARQLKKKLKTLSGFFIDSRKEQGIVYEDNVYRKLRYVGGSLNSSFDKSTLSQLTYLRQAKDALDQALNKFNLIFETDVADFQVKLKQADFSLFPVAKKLDLNWEKEKK